jgi:hypothetical protein
VLSANSIRKRSGRVCGAFRMDVEFCEDADDACAVHITAIAARSAH